MDLIYMGTILRDENDDSKELKYRSADVVLQCSL